MKGMLAIVHYVAKSTQMYFVAHDKIHCAGCINNMFVLTKLFFFVGMTHVTIVVQSEFKYLVSCCVLCREGVGLGS